MDEKPPEGNKPAVVKKRVTNKVTVPVNAWTLAIIVLLLMFGFVVWGDPDQHELFLEGVERIIAALKDLLT